MRSYKMSAPNKVTLEKRIDDYSYQVYTTADNRFWFRLVRESDRDIITDYFIGSFPKESGGCLLADCYRVLGLTPKTVVVFRDILPSKDPNNAKALAEARDLYAASGKTLLTDFGARKVDERLEKEMDKYNLVLVGGF
jgi:hypothetical protein